MSCNKIVAVIESVSLIGSGERFMNLIVYISTNID
jgi:hypothetical protein